MINETSTQWSEQCTVKSCNVFILQNNLKETQIEEECAMKKGRLFCILLLACATSRRVLVVVNTCNKYHRLRSVNASIHSVKRENNKKCNYISNFSEFFFKTISKINLTINISVLVLIQTTQKYLQVAKLIVLYKLSQTIW